MRPIVKSVRALLVNLEYRAKPDETFLVINLPQHIPLNNNPVDMLPGSARQFDFIKASAPNHLLPTAYWPNALRDAFNRTGTYRFTFLVNGDGLNAPA